MGRFALFPRSPRAGEGAGQERRFVSRAGRRSARCSPLLRRKPGCGPVAAAGLSGVPELRAAGPGGEAGGRWGSAPPALASLGLREPRSAKANGERCRGARAVLEALSRSGRGAARGVGAFPRSPRGGGGPGTASGARRLCCRPSAGRVGRQREVRRETLALLSSEPYACRAVRRDARNFAEARCCNGEPGFKRHPERRRSPLPSARGVSGVPAVLGQSTNAPKVPRFPAGASASCRGARHRAITVRRVNYGVLMHGLC